MPFANPELQALHDGDRRIVVVTAHRRENWGDGPATGSPRAWRRLAERQPGGQLRRSRCTRTRACARRSPSRSRGLDNVLLTEPLGYATFARLLARCHLVITDSGGIQEEAPSLGKPVLVARETTERTEGVDAGTLRLVGTDPDRIFAEGERLLDDPVAYARDGRGRQPLRRRARRRADRRARSSTSCSAATRRSQFGSGYSRAR